MKLVQDSAKLFFGAADDASIMYDGTDLVINAREVGAGGLIVYGGSDANPVIKLIGTRGGADDNVFLATRDTDQDNDVLRFFSHVEAGGSNAYMAIKSKIIDKTAGAIDGELILAVGENNVLVDHISIQANGNMSLLADSQKLIFGAAQDASILYDGTDLIISSADVGSGTVDLADQSAAAITGETLSEYVEMKVGGVLKKFALVA